MRLDWIDISKGIGIILVVIGHAGRGLTNANIPDSNDLLPLLDHVIYAFHMPLFFLLSGVTFGMRPPINVSQTLTKRAWRLFYAMIIWTYAFLALRSLAGSRSNSGSTWNDFFILPLPPFEHFWFIWALLVNVVFFGLLRLVCRPVLSDMWFWVGAFAIAIIAYSTLHLPERLILLFGLGLNYSMVFAFGALIGASKLTHFVPSWPVAIACAALFASGLAICTFADLPVPRLITGFGLSLIFLIPMARMATFCRRSKILQGLAFLGILSLPIYVMHTMFGAGMRIALLKAGNTDLSTHLVLGISMGVLGPVLFYLAARRLKLGRLLALE